jgi:hypothetical protein
MGALTTVEVKAFVPSKDFALCKQFYQHLGFELAWSSDDLAYLRNGNRNSLRQTLRDPRHAIDAGGCGRWTMSQRRSSLRDPMSENMRWRGRCGPRTDDETCPRRWRLSPDTDITPPFQAPRKGCSLKRELAAEGRSFMRELPAEVQ